MTTVQLADLVDENVWASIKKSLPPTEVEPQEIFSYNDLEHFKVNDTIIIKGREELVMEIKGIPHNWHLVKIVTLRGNSKQSYFLNDYGIMTEQDYRKNKFGDILK